MGCLALGVLVAFLGARPGSASGCLKKATQTPIAEHPIYKIFFSEFFVKIYLKTLFKKSFQIIRFSNFLKRVFKNT
jgi:hypothetical protein